MNSYSTNFSNTLNALSRLIIQTRYGGVPFLNDYCISLFNSNFFNVKFSELLNYLDIFDKYDKFVNKNDEKDQSITAHATFSDNRILSQYFKLDYTYLSFMDSNDVTDDTGLSNDNVYLLNTITGKAKVTTQEFIKYLNIFNAELSEIPFEYIPEDCGKKRVMRCYKKMAEFFAQFRKSPAVANHNLKFIIPIFMYHLDMIPKKELDLLVKENEGIIAGFLIITENYKKMNLEKIQKYRNFLLSEVRGEAFIKFGQGHPIDLMLSFELGCKFFEISHPFDLSEKGLCINSNYFEKFEETLSLFHTDKEKEVTLENLSNVNFSQYDLKYTDLNDKKYETDLRVIKENCTCFTCKNNYTRAYIHHLLKCHELNASTLIIAHNLHFTQNLHQTYVEIKSQSHRLSYLLKFLKEECEKTS